MIYFGGSGSINSAKASWIRSNLFFGYAMGAVSEKLAHSVTLGAYAIGGSGTGTG